MEPQSDSALYASHKLVFMDQIERLIQSNEHAMKRKLKKKYDAMLLAFRSILEDRWRTIANRFNAPLPSDPDVDFHVQLAADLEYMRIFGQYLMIPKGIKSDDVKRATIFDEEPPL